MSDKGVQVLDRAFDILELLSLEKEGLGVTEIGIKTGLHKSTVHRILSALAERGYVERDKTRGNYKIGLKLIEISSVYLNSIELKTEARPYLMELMGKVGQPVHLAILDGTDAVYIDKLEVMNNIRLYSQIGRRIPLFCSALGKSLLSGLHDGEIKQLIHKFSFEKYTENTITDPEELMGQIRTVRVSGWAVDDEEHEAGIKCIAAPVFDYRGNVIAAVSVSGPLQVISKDKDEEIAKLVMEASRQISRRLGYSSSQ